MYFSTYLTYFCMSVVFDGKSFGFSVVLFMFFLWQKHKQTNASAKNLKNKCENVDMEGNYY